MPEVPNAYRCDFCSTLMEPIDERTVRWHTKWCRACGAKLYDVFVGDTIPVVRNQGWRDDDNDYGTDAD